MGIFSNAVTVEFKLCILNANGELARWETLNANRIFSPRTSLLIRFKEAE